MIKSFLVPRDFLDKLRASAIAQFRASEKDPKKLIPRRVDETKAPDQFEIPILWIEELRRQIIQGTGRVERPKDVGIDPNGDGNSRRHR